MIPKSGTFIVGSRSSVEFGWNLDLGYAFRNGAYLEARFVQIQTDNRNSEYIPLTVGYSW